MTRRGFFAAVVGLVVARRPATEVTIRSLAWGKMEGVTFYRSSYAAAMPLPAAAAPDRRPDIREFVADLQRLNQALPTYEGLDRVSIYEV